MSDMIHSERSSLGSSSVCNFM